MFFGGIEKDQKNVIRYYFPNKWQQLLPLQRQFKKKICLRKFFKIHRKTFGGCS